MPDFGTRLRQLRHERGLHQRHIAEDLGILRESISNYERGAQIPHLPMLIDIADYFDVSLDYLLGRSEIRWSTPEWYAKLPHPLKELIDEHGIRYAKFTLRCKEEGWTPEALEEAICKLKELVELAEQKKVNPPKTQGNTAPQKKVMLIDRS